MTFQIPPTAQQVAQQIAQQVAPLIAVATFLLGQLFAIVLEWLRGRATAAREREARAQARKEAAEDRRAEFQRQTLLDLQEALQALGRTSGEAWAARMHNYGETGTWGSPFGNELLLRQQEAFTRVHVLQTRVLDERLRDLVEQVKVGHQTLELAQSKSAAGEALNAFSISADEANRRAGDLIRALY